MEEINCSNNLFCELDQLEMPADCSNEMQKIYQQVASVAELVGLVTGDGPCLAIHFYIDGRYDHSLFQHRKGYSVYRSSNPRMDFTGKCGI